MSKYKLTKEKKLIKSLNIEELKKTIETIDPVTELIDILLNELETRLSEEDFIKYCNDM